MKRKFATAALLTIGILFSNLNVNAAIVDFEDTGGSALAYRGLVFEDQGLTFTVATGEFQYTVNGSQTPPTEGVNNGTSFYIASPQTNITVTDGSAFSIDQIDLGLSLFTFPTQDVVLTGFLSNGGTLSTTFSLNDTSFQTFVLLGFSDITRLNVALANGYVAIDNIYITQSNTNVPEPATAALLSLGLFGFLASRRRLTKNTNV
jgi:hypothetical protein